MADPAPEENLVLPDDEFRCKKNDGKSWRCHRWRIHEKSLCEYHHLRVLGNATKKRRSTQTSRARGTKSRSRVPKRKGKGRQDVEPDNVVIPSKKRVTKSRSKTKGKGLQDEEESDDEVIPAKKPRTSVAYLGDNVVWLGRTPDRKKLRAKKMGIASSETNDQSEGKDGEVKEDEENSEDDQMEEKDDNTLREEEEDKQDAQSDDKAEELRDEEKKEEGEGDEEEKEGDELRVDEKEEGKNSKNENNSEEEKGVSNVSSFSPEEEKEKKKEKKNMKKDKNKSRSATKQKENECEERSYCLRRRDPKYGPQSKDGRRKNFSKDGNGEDSCNMCHQCQKSDRRVIRCIQGCRRRFCAPCIERWYPRLSEDEIAEICPCCRGNCNCKACLRRTDRLAGPIYSRLKIRAKRFST